MNKIYHIVNCNLKEKNQVIDVIENELKFYGVSNLSRCTTEEALLLVTVSLIS